MFFDFSSKDIHFSSVTTEAHEYYKNLDTSKPKYVGVTLSDKMFEEFMQEFFIRRREINVYELLKLFPDFDSATAQMYLRKLDMLLPDVVDEFGGDKIFSAIINSDAVLKDKAIVKEVQSGIKTVFKKDALDIQLAMAIELVVEESEK